MTASIVQRLFNGSIRPGEKFPSEANLAKQWGIPRSAVCETLRQLENMNLIKSRRGGGTTALDFRRHAGLSFLDAMVQENPDGPLLMDLLDFKAALDPVLARLMARVAFEIRMPDILELEALDAQVLAALGDHDLGTALNRELAYWHCIAAHLGNLSTTLFLNSTLPPMRPLLNLQLSHPHGREFISKRQRIFREASVERKAQEHYEKQFEKLLNELLHPIKQQILAIDSQQQKFKSLRLEG